MDSQLLYRRQVLCVDSTERDDYANTTASRYTIKFQVVKSIKMARLISCEIPNCAYVFNATNNNIDFSIDTGTVAALGPWPPGVPPGTYTATITPGTYTSTELANEITRAMNAVVLTGFGVTFVATYITYLQKFFIDRVDGLGNFSILFGSGPNAATSPWLQLGFLQGVDTPMATRSTSSTIIQLSGDNYMYLCVKQFPSTRNVHNIEDCFAKIILDVPPRSIVFNSFVSAEQVFDQPVDLKQLDIVFRRPDGTDVDFKTADHSFSLEFYTLN